MSVYVSVFAFCLPVSCSVFFYFRQLWMLYFLSIFRCANAPLYSVVSVRRSVGWLFRHAFDDPHALSTKTKFFSQTQLVSQVLTYISFSAWIYEETKNIFWASEIVATLTHVKKFYDLMNLKFFYFA